MVFKDEELKRNLILNKFTWKESMKVQFDFKYGTPLDKPHFESEC